MYCFIPRDVLSSSVKHLTEPNVVLGKTKHSYGEVSEEDPLLRDMEGA